jgi:multidrug efflux pump subunit AcrA (membrane-fusion protein)
VGVLSLPLRRAGEITGIILLEFNPQKKIPQNAAQSLAVAVELVSPQLFDRFQNDRWWITKTGISIRETAKMAVGPKHMLAKLIIVLVIAALAFVTFYKPMYHVTAPFSFAATEKRIVSAPFEGYIGGVVNVRPGDKVKAGDVLLEMDTSDLRVKLSQDANQAAAKVAEARKYEADPTKQADYRMAMAEADAYKAAAQLDQSQIDHAIIKAEFDGVVLSGDWMDKRRTPVRKGEELFKLGQTKGLRVEMNVAERDIQDIKLGQAGKLATTSLPTDKHPFKVERIIPLPNAEQGSNVFKVYGTPDDDSPQWRDGMQGEVNIDVEKRPLGWIWTHRFFDWLRLKMWHMT